ncbi:MAG TPA: hypothetical protein VK929_17185 [Longimicrobiales bacterium]|nr:hypothetical protein [Longimicrobiales bacterium]
MPIPRRTTPFRLDQATRRKLEVTSATAWEALVETHVEQASQFVDHLAEHWGIEDTVVRYLREMDLDETMATAIRTRVLAHIEERTGPYGVAENLPDGVTPAAGTRRDGAPGVAAARRARRPDAEEGDGNSGWGLLNQPRRMVRGMLAYQRRNETIDRVMQLSLARAEENVIRTHVENAISMVALLEDRMPLDECVQQYLGAVGLAGGRAQAVFQRTMARLADVHL